jgi:hypothetical protein
MQSERVSSKQQHAQIAQRWDDLVARVCEAGWNHSMLGVGALAESVGLEWRRYQKDMPIAEFIELDGRALWKLPSFGRKTIERLSDIVERALTLGADINEARLGPNTPNAPGLKVDTRATLAGWCVPPTFPLLLLGLSVRITNFCKECNLVTLEDLLGLWDSHGCHGFLSFRNLGKKSVEEVRQLVRLLETRDRSGASHFLPLDDSGKGLSLGKAIQLILARLPAKERELLDRRLGRQMTLEESVEGYGRTRERVRQIEGHFLTSFRNLLNWFSIEQEQILAVWVDGGDWMEPLRPCNSPNDELLIRGALVAIFRESPRGVARAMQKEAEMNHWHEALLAQPDLLIEGLNFEEFLGAVVPAESQAAFCEYITKSNGLRLDHATGLIYSRHPSARKTVQALLEREDDPIPLTWLVKLLNQIPLYAEWDRTQLLRHRARWKDEDPGFLDERILWRE